VTSAAPTLLFRVGADVFYTRDKAIERATDASRCGIMTTVVREDGLAKMVIGEALQGTWRWARECSKCRGSGKSGKKNEFSCSPCNGRGYRTD